MLLFGLSSDSVGGALRAVRVVQGVEAGRLLAHAGIPHLQSGRATGAVVITKPGAGRQTEDGAGAGRGQAKGQGACLQW